VGFEEKCQSGYNGSRIAFKEKSMPDERILIAEDEADVLDMCVRALSREGYQVLSARSGLEAIAMAKEQNFDLLLTDIRMPGLNGLQAYREIKQGNPDIIGVAITGYGSVDTAIEALKLGMDDFLLKPFSLDDLRAAVSKALASTRLERENTRLQALIPLFQLSQDFMSVTDIAVLLRRVLRVAVSDTASEVGILMLKNEASEELEVQAAIGAGGSELPLRAHQISADIIQQAMNIKEALVWHKESNQGPLFAAEAAGPGTQSPPLQSADAPQPTAAVVQPLIVGNEEIGILTLIKRREDASFSQGDLELLAVLASQAATAIQNARLFTRLRNAYEKLSALDHLKSEFISVVAHELRTPLAEISTYLALSEQETRGDRLYLDGIARAAERLTSLMNDITDLKFLETGQLALVPTELSLPQLVADVVQQLSPLATYKGLAIITSIQSNLTQILADGPKLQVVLNNLVSNAITFSATGGQIRIQATAKGGALHIAVHDKGTGIPQEEWEWIFKPFYQVESSLRREHGGMGIGLALSKNLVELHGGRIWVESEIGQGSTFHFTIPACIR
jgi:signal transduction histidine kinase/CheY-like chemotaxis protein